MNEINVRLTEVSISVLPDDHPDRSVWSVQVCWRGGDLYAVMHFRDCLNASGGWEYEPNPSSRGDEFKARTRFDYNTAYRLACEQAPLIRANGMTAADVLAREARQP